MQRTATQDELATLAVRICRRHEQRPELTAALLAAVADVLSAAERFFAAAADAAADV
jgi:hypothetical protein